MNPAIAAFKGDGPSQWHSFGKNFAIIIRQFFVGKLGYDLLEVRGVFAEFCAESIGEDFTYETLPFFQVCHLLGLFRENSVTSRLTTTTLAASPCRTNQSGLNEPSRTILKSSLTGSGCTTAMGDWILVQERHSVQSRSVVNFALEQTDERRCACRNTFTIRVILSLTQIP